MNQVLKITERSGARPLCSGLFRMHDELGVPFEVSVAQCRRRGWAPDVFGFYVQALRAGWPQERVRRVILEAVGDVDGPDAREVLEKAIGIYEWLCDKKTTPARSQSGVIGGKDETR